MFINTLPVRLRVEPDVALLPWLRQLQDQQAEMREFEYSSLVEVHGCTQVPRGRPLFETLLVFENFPPSPAARRPAWTSRSSRWKGSTRTAIR